jgi:hypothetical protein
MDLFVFINEYMSGIIYMKIYKLDYNEGCIITIYVSIYSHQRQMHVTYVTVLPPAITL